MNEQEFARRVVQHLNGELDAMPPTIRQRLKAARQDALARMGKHTRSASNWSSGGLKPDRHGWGLHRRILAPVVALLVAGAATLYWQHRQQPVEPVLYSEVADVDTEVLIDELPVVAYLDPGFEIWLYHHTPATAED